MGEASRRESKLGSIHALRGLAALWVLVFHVSLRIEKLPYLLRIVTAEGCRGVQLFYLISAFTLFRSLSLRGPEIDIQAFFVRRYFRIAPLFYLSLLFYLWLYGLGERYTLGHLKGITWANIFLNVTFLNGFHPYSINSIVPVGWSVAVEMMFYLFVPIIFLKIRSARGAVLSVVISLSASMLARGILLRHPWIPEHRLWEEFVSWWIVNQSPVFFLGLVTFFIIERSDENPIIMKWSGTLLVGSLMFLILLVQTGEWLIPRHILFSLGFVGCTTALVWNPNRLIVNPWFIWLGEISYSVYLTHTAVLHLFLKTLPFHLYFTDPGARFVVLLSLVIGTTVVVSFVTYRLIEIPGIALGRAILRDGGVFAAIRSLARRQSAEKWLRRFCRRVLPNLALMTCSIVLCVLLSEVVLSFVEKSRAGSQFANPDELRRAMLASSTNTTSSETGVNYGSMITPNPSERVIYELKPLLNVRFTNVDVRTNSFGMRNKEVAIEKPLGTYRIALLGDSYAFGWGVKEEKTFATRLEQILNERLPQSGTMPRQVEVLNFGVPGYSTFQEVEQCKKKVLQFQPDSVLVFFIDNDFGYPFFVHSVDGTEDLVQSSKLYKLGYLLTHPRGVLEELERQGLDPNSSLRDLDDFTAARGIELFLAINPRFGWRKDLKQLSVLRERSSIKLINIGPSFEKIVRTHAYTITDLNLPGDPHPSELRHEIYAQLLFPELLEAIKKHPSFADDSRNPGGVERKSVD